MDSNTLRSRRSVWAALLVVVTGLVLAPTTSFAAYKWFGLQITGSDSGSWHRVADSSQDWSMPDRNPSFTYSDIDGCAPGLYGFRLMRNRTLQPDQVILSRTSIDYCAIQQQSSSAFSSGKFHFDKTSNRPSSQTPAGSGFIEQDW